MGLNVPSDLLADLRGLIQGARETVARAVNTTLVMLYWQIGRRIRTEILKNKRATYGEEILPTLSATLTAEYGRGFSKRNLANMVRFAEVFPDEGFLQTTSAKLAKQLPQRQLRPCCGL